jgi:hypothetical protein
MRLLVLMAGLLVGGCGLGGSDGSMPGQPGYRATMTILNRTEAPVTVSSGEGGPIEVAVPPCGEVTQPDFPVNFWQVTSPGRDTFHSGGGVSSALSFAVVTETVTQQERRPNPLPPCKGLLQPAQQ